MGIDTVGKKFIHDLADIYDAEQRFLDAQEQMRAQASSSILRELLSEHIAQTRQQIANLDTIYTIMAAEPMRGTCITARALVEEGQQLMQEAAGSDALLDSAIASAAARVEHFEIACYRSLLATAEHFCQPSIMDLLRRNLEQEELTAGKVEEGYKQLLHFAVSTQKLQAAVGDRGPLF